MNTPLSDTDKTLILSLRRVVATAIESLKPMADDIKTVMKAQTEPVHCVRTGMILGMAVTLTGTLTEMHALLSE